MTGAATSSPPIGREDRAPDLPPDAPGFERAASRFPHAHGIGYRPEIDGLRAIAVSAVILYHANVFPFTGGYVGVDIFFVLSGYLISSIIIGDIARSRFSFASFYERRIKRIFPALFFVLAVATLASVAILTPQELRKFGQALVATTGFSSNIYFWMTAGYFTADTERNPLIHMWSLAVEEQFYLFFPLLLILLHRAKIGLTLPIAAALAASLAWCLRLEAQSDQAANFFLTQSRCWELMAGTLVAVNRPRWLAVSAVPQALRWGLELVGAALMIAPIFLITGATSWPGLATIPVVLGAAILLLTMSTRSPVGRLVSLPPMVRLGLLSYSAYLWHQPLFALVHVEIGHMTGPIAAVLIVVTLALAWFSWRFIERPFRAPGRFGRRWLFGTALVSTAITGVVGAALHVTDGLPQRFDPATRALAATAIPSLKRTECHTEGRDFRSPSRACRFYAAHVTWAVLGDSHAIEIGDALAADLRARNEGVVQLTFSGCQPALTFQSDNPGCSTWLDQAVNVVARDRAIRDVLLVFRHAFYLYGDQTRSYPAIPNQPPNFLSSEAPDLARTRYWASCEALVRRLLAAGKRVHIVGPIPELPASIDRYVFHHMRSEMTRDYYTRRNAAVLDRLRAIARWPGVSVIDPSDTVCGASRCRAVIDGRAMYFDDNHLSMAGARRFVALQRQRGLLP